jgi:hypothetical protein
MTTAAPSQKRYARWILPSFDQTKEGRGRPERPDRKTENKGLFFFDWIPACAGMTKGVGNGGRKAGMTEGQWK